MSKRLILLSFLFLTGIVSVKAQAFFSTDKNTFFEELSAYLATGNSKQDRDEAAAMIANLTEVWNTYYTSQETATVIRICELFHAKSGSRTYANIFNFTELVLRVPTCGLSHQDVFNWLTYTDTKTQKSLNGVEKYLASCKAVFVEKTLSSKGNSICTLREAKIGFPSKDEFRRSA